MFQGIKNLAQAFQQAREIGGKMQELSQQLRELRAEGTAGGGLVQAQVNGLQEVLRLRIDPTLVGGQGDVELLEELIRSAVNQAHAKAKDLHAEAMKSLAGTMNLPGLDEVLNPTSGSSGG